jgi:hypothetical protein
MQVSDWIRVGCSRTKKIPVVLDVEWSAWWDSLQPGWRRHDRDGKWMAGGDAVYGGNKEWGFLDRPGPNGCLSVVASLYFWGVCEEQPAAAKKQWIKAVEDVAWMLEGLTASMK